MPSFARKKQTPHFITINTFFEAFWIIKLHSTSFNQSDILY